MPFFKLLDTEDLLPTYGIILQRTNISEMQQMISKPRVQDPDLVFEVLVTMEVPFVIPSNVQIRTGITGALWNVKVDDDLEELMIKITEISKQISGSMLNDADGNIEIRTNINPTRIDPHLTELQWLDIIGIIQGRLPKMELEDISSHVARCLDSHLKDEAEYPESGDHNNCSICLEDFEQENGNTNPSLKIPCEHFFHYQCLAQWMIEQSRESSLSNTSTSIMATCPICRFQLLGDEPEESGHESEQITGQTVSPMDNTD